MATQAEIAAHLDMSERNLRDVLKKLGLPSKDNSVDQVRTAYIRHLRAQASRGTPPTPGRAADDIDPVRERGLLARAHRERIELENAKLKGTLVDAADVEKEVFEMCRTVRDRLQLIPPRVADQLVGMVDSHEINVFLDGEVRDALLALSDGDGLNQPKRCEK